MRRRIFDDLLDMQAETNRFFEEVYKRLALFETALSDWSSGRNWLNRIEASRQQSYSDNSRRAFVSERYQQVSYHPQNQRQLPQSDQNNSSDYSDYNESNDYEYDNYYGDEQQQPAIESKNRALPLNSSSSKNLPVQITENSTNVLARVELPRLRRGDINVSVVGNNLVIEGRVNKTIPLPQGVNTSQIRASYRNGVLEVRLPNIQEKKHIPIEFG